MTPDQEAEDALTRLVKFAARYGVHASPDEDQQALQDLSTLKRMLQERGVKFS